MRSIKYGIPCCVCLKHIVSAHDKKYSESANLHHALFEERETVCLGVKEFPLPNCYTLFLVYILKFYENRLRVFLENRSDMVQGTICSNLGMFCIPIWTRDVAFILTVMNSWLSTNKHYRNSLKSLEWLQDKNSFNFIEKLSGHGWIWRLQWYAILLWSSWFI